MAIRSRKPKVSVKDLVVELKDLFLREGTEMSERGFYQRILPSLPLTGGHIDKDSVNLARIKEIILELEKIV